LRLRPFGVQHTLRLDVVSLALLRGFVFFSLSFSLPYCLDDCGEAVYCSPIAAVDRRRTSDPVLVPSTSKVDPGISEMRARLGKTLYWLGCTLSVIALIWGVYLLRVEAHSQHDRAFTLVMSILVAGVFWLIGRTFRNVFSDK
jgi:hypothetical protein